MYDSFLAGLFGSRLDNLYGIKRQTGQADIVTRRSVNLEYNLSVKRRFLT